MQQIRVGFMVCICVEDVTYGIFSIAIPPLVGVLALLFGAKRARANSYQLNPYLQRLWRIFVLMRIAHLCILKIESSNTSLCESWHGNLNWWIYVSTDTWKPPWGKTLHLIQFSFIYLQFPQVLGCSVTARAEQEAGWCRLYKYSIQIEFSLWFCCYSRLASKWYNMYVYIYIYIFMCIYIVNFPHSCSSFNFLSQVFSDVTNIIPCCHPIDARSTRSGISLGWQWAGCMSHSG